jgi:hypothetical protein
MKNFKNVAITQSYYKAITKLLHKAITQSYVSPR